VGRALGSLRPAGFGAPDHCARAAGSAGAGRCHACNPAPDQITERSGWAETDYEVLDGERVVGRIYPEVLLSLGPIRSLHQHGIGMTRRRLARLRARLSS
jgi:hypothetical protein